MSPSENDSLDIIWQQRQRLLSSNYGHINELRKTHRKIQTLYPFMHSEWSSIKEANSSLFSIGGEYDQIHFYQEEHYYFALEQSKDNNEHHATLLKAAAFSRIKLDPAWILHQLNNTHLTLPAARYLATSRRIDAGDAIYQCAHNNDSNDDNNGSDSIQKHIELLWCATLLRHKKAQHELLDAALNNPEHLDTHQLNTLSLLMPDEQSSAWVGQLQEHPEKAIQAAALSGNIRWIPWLLEQFIQHPINSLNAISQITGLAAHHYDIINHNLHKYTEEQLAYTQQALQHWWQQQSHFNKHKRYFLGQEKHSINTDILPTLALDHRLNSHLLIALQNPTQAIHWPYHG